MKHAKKTARFGALLCLCLSINALETLLLIPLSLPIPGAKLGLSNLVILYCIYRKEKLTPFALALSRALVGTLLFGNPVSFLFSVCGGLMSIPAMQISLALLKHGFSSVSISICGSVFFQIGQLLVGQILYGRAILYYAPALFASAIVSGIILGLLHNLLAHRLKKIDPVEE